MSDIIVKRVGEFWTAVNNSVILAEGLAAPQVIAKAVALASEAAKREGPTRVICQNSDLDRQVVWASQRDSFSGG